MKKVIVAFGVFLIIGVLVVLQKLGLSTSLKASRENVPSINTNSSQSETINPSQSTLTPTASSSVGQKYKDGSYTGKVADAFYGDYQVKAIILNGKISDIQFLVYPADRRTSIEINQESMPLLKQEAIVSQDAAVDIISGATQSSIAFKESLQSALDQAL